MELTQISEDILILVLVHLDVSSLAACKQVSFSQRTPKENIHARLRQVCRRFLQIINASPRLQYNIELGVAGVENGCPDGIGPSTAERRQALVAYSESWRDLNFPDQIDLTRDHEMRSIASDGYVLARISFSNVLEVIQFPSRIRHPESALRTWTIAGADMADAGIKLGICAVDSTQDLLVVVEQFPGHGRVPLLARVLHIPDIQAYLAEH